MENIKALILEIQLMYCFRNIDIKNVEPQNPSIIRVSNTMLAYISTKNSLSTLELTYKNS